VKTRGAFGVLHLTAEGLGSLYIITIERKYAGALIVAAENKNIPFVRSDKVGVDEEDSLEVMIALKTEEAPAREILNSIASLIREDYMDFIHAICLVLLTIGILINGITLFLVVRILNRAEHRFDQVY
jgi:hypothetical protein